MKGQGLSGSSNRKGHNSGTEDDDNTPAGTPSRDPRRNPRRAEETRRKTLDVPVLFVPSKKVAAISSKDASPRQEQPFKRGGKVTHSPQKPTDDNNETQAEEESEPTHMDQSTTEDNHDAKRKRDTSNNPDTQTDEASDKEYPLLKHTGKKYRSSNYLYSSRNSIADYGNDSSDNNEEVDIEPGISRLRELRDDFDKYATKDKSADKYKFQELRNRLNTVFTIIEKDYKTFARAQRNLEKNVRDLVIKNKRFEEKIDSIETHQKEQDSTTLWKKEINQAMDQMLRVMDQKLEAALGPKSRTHHEENNMTEQPPKPRPTVNRPAQNDKNHTSGNDQTNKTTGKPVPTYAQTAAKPGPSTSTAQKTTTRTIKDLQKMIPAQEKKTQKPANWGVLRAPACIDPINLLKKIYNPKSEGVTINSIVYTTNKNILIRADKEEDIAKMKNSQTLQQQGFVMATVTDKRPRIMIYGIDEDNTKETLLTQVFQNNSWAEELKTEEELIKQFLPLYSFQPRKDSTKKNWIVEVSPKIRKTIETNNWKIKTLWARHRAADYLDAVRCFKCQYYGHPAKYCRHTNKTCGHCGQAGHSFNDCLNKNKPPVCTPCKVAHLSSEHSINDKNCPSKIRAIKERIRNTTYA